MLNDNEIGWSWDFSDDPIFWADQYITGIDLYITTNALDKSFNEILKWNDGLLWTEDNIIIMSYRLYGITYITDGLFQHSRCNLFKFHSNPEILYGYDVLINNDQFNEDVSGILGCDQLAEILNQYSMFDVVTTCFIEPSIENFNAGFMEAGYMEANAGIVPTTETGEWMLNQIGRSTSEISN